MVKSLSLCPCLPSLFQNGQTPLMVAAEQGNFEITQELIRRGANVNLDDVVSMQTHKAFKGDRPLTHRYTRVIAQVKNNVGILTTLSI